MNPPPLLNLIEDRPIRRWSVNRFWWLGLLAGAGVLLILRQVEPKGQFFYPRCWMWVLTGLQCPGCGGLRAGHALLNGDIVKAWQLNPLVVALVPVGAWLGLVYGLRGWRGIELPHPFGHRYALCVLVGLIAGYGIGRNLVS